MGAVLSQVRNGEEHPVTFISRKLLKHEQNYATVEKECLAIKWAITKFKYFLLGRTFTLITDHAPLKWMALNKGKNARVTRWFLELQDYHFKVVHRPGKEHGNADALSRRHDCLWSVAPCPTMELGGEICGEHKAAALSTEADRQEQGRRRGQVIGGRYYLSEVLRVWSAHTPAPHGTLSGLTDKRPHLTHTLCV